MKQKSQRTSSRDYLLPLKNRILNAWRANRGTKRGKMSLEMLFFTYQWELFMGISLPLYLDWGNPVRDIEIKKRYAYLVNWKRRKFHNYTQGWHSGSHAIAWAAITTFVCTGFLRPPIQNVAFAVPRFCVINGSIGTKRAIGIRRKWENFNRNHITLCCCNQYYGTRTPFL